MVKHLLTLILIINTLFAVGQQNLVPNPSFEQLTSCPDSPGDIALASPWFQPALFSSTDLFNECSLSADYKVPVNGAGEQYAHSGKGYTGIGVWAAAFEGREYLEVQLTEPLKAGKKYCFEMYVSLADTSRYAISNLGAFFSPDSVTYSATPSTPGLLYTPNVNNASGVIDKEDNWVLISGQFIATGGEQFVTIGNFYSDANTTFQEVGDSDDSPSAYYYIDDVSVTCCDENGCDALDDLPNVFTPNGDGLNDVFFIDASAFTSMSCEIYNRWGIKVASLSEGNSSWDGRTTSGQEALEGVYYYVVRARDEKGGEISRTGFVQLLR